MWDPIYDDNLSSLDPFHANQTNQKYFDMFLTFSILSCKVLEVKWIFSLNFRVFKILSIFSWQCFSLSLASKLFND